MHQYPYYPGGGTEYEKGEHNNALNIPLPAGTNSREYFDAYEHMLRRLKKFTNGKVVSVLEGGYDLNALAESANEHVNALLEFNWKQ